MSVRKKCSIPFDVIRLKINPPQLNSIKIQSDSIRLNLILPIRMNPKEVLNPNESEVRMILTEFSLQIIRTSDLLVLKNWSGFIRIQNLGLSRIYFLLIRMNRDSE